MTLTPRTRKIGINRTQNRRDAFCGQRELSNAVPNRRSDNRGSMKSNPAKQTIFLAVRDVLRRDEVVWIKTPADRAVRCLGLNANQTILPSARQNSRFRADALRVVPKGVLKLRPFADGAVDQIGKLGTV